MLKIRIIAIGRHKDRWVEEGCAHFEKLLSRFAKIEWKILAPPKESSSLTPTEIKIREARLLEKECQKGLCVALSDKGELRDTPAFAKMLETIQITSGGIVNFIIGGAYGLDDSILNKADHILSLSPLTFSHQLVRLILLEQLYRAFALLREHPYPK
ncbi:MAG: 23S rRNA (pseudouridine(1915)-N(3))-methyltransferase RlmH [Candidatus Zixiibacteriota bacterium]